MKKSDSRAVDFALRDLYPLRTDTPADMLTMCESLPRRAQAKPRQPAAETSDGAAPPDERAKR